MKAIVRETLQCLVCLLVPGALAMGSTVGCMASTDPLSAEDEEVDGVEAVGTTAAIKSGYNVALEDPYWRSTVSFLNCTGTIIATRFVVTAAHCGIQPGTRVYFYRGSDIDFTKSASVVHTFENPGVSATDPVDWYDAFADFSVVELDRDIPEGYRPALVAGTWPGPGVTMIQVGQGNHDGLDNSQRVLRYRVTQSRWEGNATGAVLVEDSADLGDSGGPIFTVNWSGELVVHGALWGYVWEWGYRSKYTSLAWHSHTIRSAAHLFGQPSPHELCVNACQIKQKQCMNAAHNIADRFVCVDEAEVCHGSCPPP